MKTTESIEVMQTKFDVFNEKHPVGSPVTLIKDLCERFVIQIRAPASILSGHTPVVWVEGITGCYLLDRVIG
jgi:hypothetical protein